MNIKRKKTTINIQNRINNQIPASELRVVDENGENIGVISKEEALRLAQEKGLDLIEIASAAKPPVAKIMSFDKFRYQKDKELKKQRQSQKDSELKQIRIGARSAKNDLEVRVKQLEKFLNAGDKVEIMLVLKGREKYNRDWAMMKMKEFLAMITIETKIILEPKFGGKGLLAQVIKK